MRLKLPLKFIEKVLNELPLMKIKYKQAFIVKVKQGDFDLKEGKGFPISIEKLENLCKTV